MYIPMSLRMSIWKRHSGWKIIFRPNDLNDKRGIPGMGPEQADEMIGRTGGSRCERY